MSASERSIRHGDDTAELRARYNQLCAALTALAGHNGKAADRVLQELQTLAQKIAFRQAEIANGDRAASAAGEAADVHAEAPAARASNVIAFRCKVKGVSRDHPRLAAALSPLATDGPRAAEAPPATPPAATPTPWGLASRDDGRTQLSNTVVEQGQVIDRLARRSDEQADAIERFERQLGTSGPLSTLSVQVAALRAATQRQGQQMVSLATSVHRLAKLLASQLPEDQRR